MAVALRARLEVAARELFALPVARRGRGRRGRGRWQRPGRVRRLQRDRTRQRRWRRRCGRGRRKRWRLSRDATREAVEIAAGLHLARGPLAARRAAGGALPARGRSRQARRWRGRRRRRRRRWCARRRSRWRRRGRRRRRRLRRRRGAWRAVEHGGNLRAAQRHELRFRRGARVRVKRSRNEQYQQQQRNKQAAARAQVSDVGPSPRRRAISSQWHVFFEHDLLLVKCFLFSLYPQSRACVWSERSWRRLWCATRRTTLRGGS